MSTEKQIERQYIRGLAFPYSPEFSTENVEAALNYKPRDGDIIISTFPKTGTTWIQYIVYEILNDGKVPPSQSEMGKVIPFLEATGTELIESLPSPRAVKYHVPYDLLPQNPKAKYISVIRNPYDVVVSYYHFLKQIAYEELKFEDLFDAFACGDCVYGDYFDHILSWYHHKDDNNVLLLSYEQMKNDPRSELLKIASFLERNLEGKDALIERILTHTSFAYMKANVQPMTKKELLLTKSSNEKVDGQVDFFRSGASGKGIEYLTKIQEGILKNRIEEKLKGTDIQLLWS